MVREFDFLVLIDDRLTPSSFSYLQSKNEKFLKILYNSVFFLVSILCHENNYALKLITVMSNIITFDTSHMYVCIIIRKIELI